MRLRESCSNPGSVVSWIRSSISLLAILIGQGGERLPTTTLDIIRNSGLGRLSPILDWISDVLSSPKDAVPTTTRLPALFSIQIVAFSLP